MGLGRWGCGVGVKKIELNDLVEGEERGILGQQGMWMWPFQERHQF